MASLMTNVMQMLNRFNPRQRLVVTVAMVGIVSALVALVMWANRPEYELLFANLEPDAASSIVAGLRDNNVSYKISNNGKSIYIPKEHVSEMRLKFVQSTDMHGGVVGYELFEQNQMGMTTFMQRLNMRRALEGELMRTINQMPEILQSRVHLVIPENRLFEKDRKGSASVLLHIRPGREVSAAQVQGITAMVANSVENLATSDVAVLSASGVMLSKGGESAVVGSANSKWELQGTIEGEFQRKVTEMIEGIVGYGNSVVNVAVELDFDRIERTVEEVDPDKVAILSEETYSENNDNKAGQAEKTTSNYELSRKLEHYISDVGNIKKISVAVLVNGKYEESAAADGETGDGSPTYVARTNEELEEIALLVKSTIGFDESRGDNVQVRNLPFETAAASASAKTLEKMIENERYEKFGLYGAVAIALLMGFFVLRKILNSSIDNWMVIREPATNALAGAGGDRALPASESGAIGRESSGTSDLYLKKLSPEAREKVRLHDSMSEEITQFVDTSPEKTAQLVRGWLIDANVEPTTEQ